METMRRRYRVTDESIGTFLALVADESPAAMRVDRAVVSECDEIGLTLASANNNSGSTLTQRGRAFLGAIAAGGAEVGK